MRNKSTIHADWLRLLETNTPVLGVSVMQEFYPSGVDGLDAEVSSLIRENYRVWRDRRDEYLESPPDEASRAEARQKTKIELFHRYWIELVVGKLLGWPARCLVDAVDLWPDLACKDVSLRALTYNKKTKLLFAAFKPEEDFFAKNGELLSPVEKLAQTLRQNEGAPRVALATDGERWTLVSAPEKGPDAFATWYAGDWRRERELLRAFATLFSITSLFRAEGSLEELLALTIERQDAVTDTLGEQVQRAVEVLVQSLDRVDAGSERSLLRDVDTRTVYEASLTVMMRLVFILCAEERRLLPLGEALYDENYAISTLREQLRTTADTVGEATLERRCDAWVRFLALCRILYGGVTHPDLRMPALGGSIFDPDRYPFLEGRDAGEAPAGASPLPIDNRTFLYLLEALQVIQHPNGAEFVSYGSLDVEQIGHIYEGLLELKVERATRPMLRLDANRKAPEPEQSLELVESLAKTGTKALVEHLANATRVSPGKLEKLLGAEPEASRKSALLFSCCGDEAFARRVEPFLNLLKTDVWGRPIVYKKGSLMVSAGTSRRDSGSYYTPRSFTRDIVEKSLEPLVYEGPAEGWKKEAWKLRTPDAILSLKVCDPAMGSGAFLVQTCRYLADKLVASWNQAASAGKFVSAEGEVLDAPGASEPMTPRMEERIVEARRLVAERCLYGVDVNPLAVELAKLSLWLFTLAKGRPFAFLDHCFGCGDSLLGLHRSEELSNLAKAGGLFGELVKKAFDDAVSMRCELRHAVVRDIRDIRLQAQKLREVEEKMSNLDLVADVLILKKILEHEKKKKTWGTLAITSQGALDGDAAAVEDLHRRREASWKRLQGDDIGSYRPFHWCLRFPEVDQQGGFDAIVGNPPFIGNTHWRERLGSLYRHLPEYLLGTNPGKIDLSVVFQRRAFALLRTEGNFGLIATTNLSEGVAVKVGLGILCLKGCIYSAFKSVTWPGSANINVAIVCFHKGAWQGDFELDGSPCGTAIAPNLRVEMLEKPWELQTQLDASRGINSTHIDDVLLKPEDPEFGKISIEDSTILLPILNGKEINFTPLNTFERYALDTRNHNLEHIRSRSESAYDFLLSRREKRLESIRSQKAYESWESRWWQHWRPREDFLDANSNLDFLLFSVLTKYAVPRRKQGVIGTDAVVLVPVRHDRQHAVCLSSVFQLWLLAFSGAKKGSDRVSSSILPGTIKSFALPSGKIAEDAQKAASRFDAYLGKLGGVTPAMNALCDENNRSADVRSAREDLRIIDKAVFEAYDWKDLTPDYEYRNDGAGTRLLLKKNLEKKVLLRLLEKNKQCWEQEKQAETQKDKK